MLHQKMNMTTTQRLARLETAQELLCFLMASCAEKIYIENRKPHPDSAKIAQWEAERKALFDLEDGLRLNDQVTVEQVISTYGPAAKAAFQVE